MRLVPLFVALFWLLPTGRMLAQVVPDRTLIAFETIERGTDRVVDITFANQGDKNALVLTTEAMPEYTTRWSERKVAPGESITLRVKFNPNKKGRYDDKITVFFSTMMAPIELRFTADVQFVDRSDNPACPDFGTRPANCCENDEFTVEVVDRETQLPIRGARVRIYEQGRKQRDVRADREGIYTEPIPIGFYLVHASSEGYSSSDTTGYINRRNNFIRLELQPLEPVPQEEVIEEVVEAVIEEGVDETPAEVVILTGGLPDDIRRVEEENAVVQPAVADVVVTSSALPENSYAPNRIVFLVDVSQSMFYKSRLELLKGSMLGMIDVLRQGDQVALVSYAQTTEEVIGMTSGADKKTLEVAVSGLTAGGRTTGAKGFRKAYGLLSRSRSDQANHQLMVVTDGAFSTIDGENIVALAKEYAQEGIVTTIVGVRCSDSGREKLAAIAAAAGGSFILIDDLDDEGALLLEEIRQRSKISN